MLPVNTMRSVVKRFPKPVETALRNTLWSATPIRHQSTNDVIFHCCTWKSASQWVKAVLSDPRVYRGCGLRAKQMTPDEWHASGLTGSGSIQTKKIYTPLYLTYSDIAGQLDAHPSRAFFVIRDPRDLLVSRYFSRLSAHPLTDRIAQFRAELEAMSKEQGLVHVLSDFGSIIDIGDDWLRSSTGDQRAKIVRYEDLTGADDQEHWAQLLQHLDIDVSDRQLARILNDYRFENISGGRPTGHEDTSHKYRKGEPGDWVNHLTPGVLTELESTYGDVATRWGYVR